MNTDEIKCRLCKNQLRNVKGCVTCLSLKRCIEWPNPEAETNHTVEELAQDAARMLKEQMGKLREKLDCEREFNAKSTRELNSMTKALTSLIAEMRKHAQEQKGNIAKMSRQEQRDLILKEVFAVLPEVDRVSWIDAARQLHEDIRTPIQQGENN
jgi:hypothetical protein